MSSNRGVLCSALPMPRLPPSGPTLGAISPSLSAAPHRGTALVVFLRILPIVNRHSFVHYVGILFRHPTFVHFPKWHSGSKHRSLGWMSSNRGILFSAIFRSVGVLCSSLSKSELFSFTPPRLIPPPKGTIFFRDMQIKSALIRALYAATAWQV